MGLIMGAIYGNATILGARRTWDSILEIESQSPFFCVSSAPRPPVEWKRTTEKKREFGRFGSDSTMTLSSPTLI